MPHRHRPTPRGTILLAAVAAALVAPPPASAQEHGGADGGGLFADRPPVFFLAANVVLGAVSALTKSLLTEAAPLPAAGGGALGGAVMFGGQRLVGGGELETRFIGLQVVAVGASVGHNAGVGRPLFGELTLPVYPAYVHIRPGTERPVSARLSAAALVGLVATAVRADYEARLDWMESLATGAPVFRSPHARIYAEPPTDPACYRRSCEGAALGRHFMGTIVYAADAEIDRRHLLAHEAGHLAQRYRDAILHAIPVSDAVSRRLGGEFPELARYLVLDFFVPIAYTDRLLRRHDARGRVTSFYEGEAAAMTE